jgi:hypothetical protein
VLLSQSASSLAANRIWVADGKDLRIPNNDGVWLKYVGDSWIVFGGATTNIRAHELSLEPVAEPTALANGSTTNNYSPFPSGVSSHVRQDLAGATATITGISAAGAPNSEGRVLVFTNISATGTLTVKHDDSGSSAVNRILCPGAADITLGPLSSMALIYDLNVGIWRVIAAPTVAGNPGTQPMINGEASSIPIGTPVYVSASGTVKKAKADAFNTSVVVGLVQDTSIASSATGKIAIAPEVLTATTGQWDAVAGTTGGLAFGTIYYVSPTTAGQLTSVKPTIGGQFVMLVGVGLSSTEMAVRLEGPRAAATSRFMFPIWGQSNAFGQQGTANLLNAQRINIGNVYANVNFRQKSSQPPAADPILWTTDSFGSLSSYTSTQDNNSSHGIDGTGLGPAQSLGRHLDYFERNKCDITCVGVSGSTLAVDWLPTGTFPAGTNLYDQALAVTNAAMASFGSQIAGFFWVQGETDATDAGQAAAYEANLTALFNAVRAAYGPIPIVFAQLQSGVAAAHVATIRTAQANVAAAFSNCTLVLTDDIGLGGDNIHYTADGYAALGDRMASAMIDLLGWTTPVVGWTVDKYSLIGLPQSAAEWTAVLAAAAISSGGPSSLYLLQEASGNIADSISGLTMTVAGAGLNYQVALPDWHCKALEFTEGGNAVFSSTNAALPDPATTSQARIMYAAMYASASEQNMYLWGTAGFAAIARIAGGGGTEWEIADGGVKVTSATSVTGTVRPYVHCRKVPAVSRVDAYTDNDHISGTFGVVTGKKNELGCEFGTPHFTPFYVVDFFGTPAELVTAQWRTILQLLNWGNVSLGAVAIPW